MPSFQSALDLAAIEQQQAQYLQAAIAATQALRQCGVLHIELRHRRHAKQNQSAIGQMAQALQPMLREHDQLFQIDHQTLALLLPNIAGVSHAMLAANRAHMLLSENPDSIVRLHPHIGIAIYPEHGENLADLLHAAGIAAREFSQENIGVYDAERDWLGTQIARLETPLREALAQNRFHLAFQPKISCLDQSVSGAEILLRWEDAFLGSVPPDQIVNVAEHLGLMDTLTRWVIQSGLRQFAQLRVDGFTGTMSLNLCPSNLSDASLATYIANALEVWGIPANTLILEITESALIDDIELALKQLYQLKAMGCMLALDDFGTGYSSLSYLKRLPIDELKIDRSFIKTIEESSKDAAIVQSIIELAHRLNLTVTAEGVEDIVGVEFLQQHHCDTIQGFFYSRPLTFDAFKVFYAQSEPTQ
ncbi:MULTISPECIES: putative bifunctional diguanylate cyclase/phosphodiesterase [Deefgea]|uniref:EAL domain-containing protein n=1 Tax=Deefgea chitinilytica TaxID=570276 RepID=A0ABS2CE54_9NEIS|nr:MULTISPECIES: GGDEF domain-containing phosphodiesterase [Deefgea]MBM5571960.1 EAL domain-containing protein [Deefgea chitinilytica]MBM9889195.1 EAL domain-containing protein [Deefgea sp. CFH1-16]